MIKLGRVRHNPGTGTVHALLRWPDDLYIPGNEDYRNYWFVPCPDRHRYSAQWFSPTDGPNQASAGDGHVRAYTSLNPYTPHAHSEATNNSGRCDETYVKVKGDWHYLYWGH